MAMLTFYNSVLSVDYKYKEYLVLSLVYAVAGIGGSVLLILTLCRGQGYLGRILGTLIPAASMWWSACGGRSGPWSAGNTGATVWASVCPPCPTA